MKLFKEFKDYLDRSATSYVLLDLVRTEFSDLLAEELETSGHFVYCNVSIRDIRKPEFWKKYSNLDWVILQGPPDRFPLGLLGRLISHHRWSLAILAFDESTDYAALLTELLGQPAVIGNNKRKHWLIWSQTYDRTT